MLSILESSRVVSWYGLEVSSTSKPSSSGFGVSKTTLLVVVVNFRTPFQKRTLRFVNLYTLFSWICGMRLFHTSKVICPVLSGIVALATLYLACPTTFVSLSLRTLQKILSSGASSSFSKVVVVWLSRFWQNWNGHSKLFGAVTWVKSLTTSFVWSAVLVKRAILIRVREASYSARMARFVVELHNASCIEFSSTCNVNVE